jgi:hypothetical protein
MARQSELIQVITDSRGFVVGRIYGVYENGHYTGSFFTQQKVVKRGAAVQYGINHGLIPVTDRFAIPVRSLQEQLG